MGKITEELLFLYSLESSVLYSYFVLKKVLVPLSLQFHCSQNTATLLDTKRGCWRFDPRTCIIRFLKHAYYVTRSLKRGQIELGVHIADVSHFVRPGSLTDTEAKTRYIYT